MRGGKNRIKRAWRWLLQGLRPCRPQVLGQGGKHQEGQLSPSAPVLVEEVGMELEGPSITLEMEIHLESSFQAWHNSPCPLQRPLSKSVSSEKPLPPKIPVQQRAPVKGPTSLKPWDKDHLIPLIHAQPVSHPHLAGNALLFPVKWSFSTYEQPQPLRLMVS